MMPEYTPAPRTQHSNSTAGYTGHPQASVDILGVQVHCVDTEGMLAQIAAWVDAARSAQTHCRQVCTVNPEFIVDARRSPEFAAVLARADLRVPDGIGVLWAARMQGVRLPERVTGSDGIYDICKRAAREGWRVYFLGAAPGVAQHTAEILSELYPGLRVAGCFPGSPSDTSWPEIAERLTVARPDILFVAYGHPRQDHWIDRHRHELPVAVALGVGGAFDFVAGVTPRAPRWMRDLGLEWLYRLIRQPWRWRRMAKLPVFGATVLAQTLRRPHA